ncbi:MAG: thiamine phosphate synthase [Gemmatimonadetes bacterium]|nr:thiamine phosphate synthase [Gemmatimonadota bacterium]MCY3942862.1 thiamine phosphate synthase [Gemmatimonadota bacterium]
MSSRSVAVVGRAEDFRGVPRLHVVAGDAVIAAPDWRRRLLRVAHAGRGRVALHLRARSSSAARLCEVAEWLVEAAAELGTLIVVNDRVDVALAVGAGGAQLREDSIGVADALAVVRSAARRSDPTESPRRVLLLGKSIHSPAQVPELDGSGASWLLLGSVYPTPSHPGGGAIGPDAVAAACVATGLPVLAIGGVGPAEARGLLDVGAHGVAAASGVWEAGDPGSAVGRYLDAL